MDEIKSDPYRLLDKMSGVSSYKFRIGDYRGIIQIINDKLILHAIKIKYRSQAYKKNSVLISKIAFYRGGNFKRNCICDARNNYGGYYVVCWNIGVLLKMLPIQELQYCCSKNNV